MAYFECMQDVKLLVDLIRGGSTINMKYSASNTAEDGEYVSGARIANEATRAEMKRVLDDIQSCGFARGWMLESKVRQTSLTAMGPKMSNHPIEQIGENLRGMMP